MEKPTTSKVDEFDLYDRDRNLMIAQWSLHKFFAKVAEIADVDYIFKVRTSKSGKRSLEYNLKEIVASNPALLKMYRSLDKHEKYLGRIGAVFFDMAERFQLALLFYIDPFNELHNPVKKKLLRLKCVRTKSRMAKFVAESFYFFTKTLEYKNLLPISLNDWDDDVFGWQAIADCVNVSIPVMMKMAIAHKAPIAIIGERTPFTTKSKLLQWKYSLPEEAPLWLSRADVEISESVFNTYEDYILAVAQKEMKEFEKIDLKCLEENDDDKESQQTNNDGSKEVL